MPEGNDGRGALARVVVVDAHPVMREVVRLACETSHRLAWVGEAPHAEGGLEMVRALAPHVVVLGLALEGEATEFARAVKEEAPSTRILLMATRAGPETMFESMRLGVDGFLERSSDVGRIIDAIERVAAGERLFSPEQDRGAIDELGKMVRSARDSAAAAAALTDREREVLQLVADGLSTRQIATRLNLSPRTVETHIEKLYGKLGVRSRVQALSRAVSLGLIDLGPS